MSSLLYIVAAPYSGSTLLAMLLAAAPAIGTIGERGHFHRKTIADPIVGSPDCSCGRPFAECDYWQAIYAALRTRVDPDWLRAPFSTFELYRRPRRWRAFVNDLCLRLAIADRLDRLPPPWRHRFQEMQAANAALIESTLAVSGASLFLDSSKQVSHAVYLARTAGLHVRAVHLLRDGRGHLNSTLRHHPERGAAYISRQWATVAKKQATVLRAAAIPHLTLRYEALCTDPAAILTQIYEFCGLPPSPLMLPEADETHIMGNPMRLTALRAIKVDDRWRAELSPVQLATFEAAAGPLNRQLGAPA